MRGVRASNVVCSNERFPNTSVNTFGLHLRRTTSVFSAVASAGLHMLTRRLEVFRRTHVLACRTTLCSFLY